MIKTKIQCSCGQENQLVFLDGKWHYDLSRHGNGEPCEGKCFNCWAPLKDNKIFPAGSIEAPSIAEGPEAAEGPKEASRSMTRRKLLEIAEKTGIEVPAGAKKAVILELIQETQKDEAKEPIDE